MAPPADAAKALQSNRQRPSTRVVPAIPLPYLQKRKQNIPTPKKVEEETALPVAETPTSLSPAAADLSPVVNTNGVSDDADAGSEVIEPITPITPATPAVEEEVKVSGEVEEVGVQSPTEGEHILFGILLPSLSLFKLLI